MLTATKNITLTGRSKIDGTEAEGYTATINAENPSGMTITSFQINKALYKENRTQCRQDRADFEEMAYALQEEMIAAQAEMAETETTTES